MHLKIISLFIFLSCFAYHLAMHAKHHSKKRSVIAVGLNILAETTSNLKTAYDNGKLKDASEIALTVVESLPIVGKLVYLFAENPDKSEDSEIVLNDIHKNFNMLSVMINDVGNKVVELSKEIELSVLKNQVANANRGISNCYKNFLLFLRNPQLQAEQDRIKTCYYIFEYVREIGNLLNNKKITFMQKTLFDQIIDETGHCDGRNLNAVYRYLLGLYFQGCTACVASEILLYKNESTTFRNECVTTLQLAQKAHLELYAKCKMEPCQNIKPIMKDILSQENGTKILTTFHKVFPWFHPLIILFKKSNESDITFFDGNYVAMSSGSTVTRVLMWSSFNVTTSGKFKYGVEYNSETEYFKINEMGLLETNNINQTRTALVGRSSERLRFCVDTIQSEDSDEDQSQVGKKWVIIVGVVSVLIVLFFGLLVICITRNGKREYSVVARK